MSDFSQIYTLKFLSGTSVYKSLNKLFWCLCFCKTKKINEFCPNMDCLVRLYANFKMEHTL